MQALIWGLKCLLSMLRCMLGSVKHVKHENPKGKGKLGNGKGVLKKKTTAVVESLSTTSTRCSVTEITNRMRTLHQIILQEYGLEALHLFRDWESLWLRASDYKNLHP